GGSRLSCGGGSVFDAQAFLSIRPLLSNESHGM
ncbi:MAG: hypothetical protein ACI9NQ_001228, partial [Paracoccaceae bacterium]